MILPIVAYGNAVLKAKAATIAPEHVGLMQLIADMYETMYAAQGVGLAAPQVGQSIQLFVVDAKPFAEDAEDETDEEKRARLMALRTFKQVFINPQILEERGEPWSFNEGCLSIPGIRENVQRQPEVHLRYFDEHFNEHTQWFSGLAARVIQHEYDHLQGVLFTDRLNPLRRQLLKRKLNDITSGKAEADYKIRFPRKK